MVRLSIHNLKIKGLECSKFRKFSIQVGNFLSDLICQFAAKTQEQNTLFSISKGKDTPAPLALMRTPRLPH